MGMKPVLNEPHRPIMNAGTVAKKVDPNAEIKNSGTCKSGGQDSSPMKIQNTDTPPAKR